MKNSVYITLAVVFASVVVNATASTFASLHVFGDTLSATTNVPGKPTAPGGSYFYGQRWSNGRVWVEVLAQRQAIPFNHTNNYSYYDHNSSLLADEISTSAKTYDSNALVVVWVCNADSFDHASDLLSSNNWVAANDVSITNHLKIIKTLYGQGTRTLVMPNAVDISKIPAFNAANSKLISTMRYGCQDFNQKFASMVDSLRQNTGAFPGLKIYTPDYFTLMNNVLANAGTYGLTNALTTSGYTADAYEYLTSLSISNGIGTNYVFWDPQDPSAKLHAIMADVAQQLISPVQISQLVLFDGSNRLDLVNLPVGMTGVVEGCTNLLDNSWATVGQSFTAKIPTAQSVFVPPPDATTQVVPNWDIFPPNTVQPEVDLRQLYRLRFPHTWVWP